MKQETTKPPRSRNPDAKRQAILDAGLALFAERGYHGVNTADVARTAGVAVGTLFRLFKTKEELANQVYLYCARLYDAHLPAAMPGGLPPRRQFAALWSAMVGFYRENALGFIFYELVSHRDYLDDTGKLARQTHKAFIFEAIKAWQSKGVLRRDSHEAIRAVVIGSFGRLVREASEGDFEITDKMLAGLEELCWTAIRNPEWTGSSG